jgi:signal transduction histidine kinase
MRIDWRRSLPRTIAGQLTAVLVAAVLFGVCLVSALMFYLIYSGDLGPSRETLAEVRAARIAAVVNGVRQAKSPAEAVALAKRANEDPVRVRWGLPPAGAAVPPTGLVADVEDELRRSWRVESAPHSRNGAEADNVYVLLDDGRSLRFTVGRFGGVGSLVVGQTLFTLGVITSLVLAVSAYAVRWVTAPLSSIASAARAFGRPGGDGDGVDLDERGPVEIAQAARALNDMRARVRLAVDERTRMFAAVSHDLRTPLTRLRLRIDRLPEAPAKVEMLREIAAIDEMLAETLAYLREQGQGEAASPTDLPSLVQTICAQFADTGHDVAYRGPDRLVLVCRPHALTRAVTNLVDNAVKFGAHVEVAVTPGEGQVSVEVLDDGPGVAPNMLGRVFEPFFKGDESRGQDQGGGFGLGLSIVREIAERHGGAVELVNAQPHGLRARLKLPN